MQPMVRLAGIWPVLLLLACGDGPVAESATGDAGPTTSDAGDGGRPVDRDRAGDPDAGDPDAGPPDAGADDGAVPTPTPSVQPQTNVDFASALELDLARPVHLQDVRRADQVDYYRFSAAAGDCYELNTDRGSFQPDAVLSLYDAEHNLLMRNDSGWRIPGDGIDARLVFRAQRAGEYFVTVATPGIPASFFERDFALLYYHLSFEQLVTGPGFSLVDDETTPTADWVEFGDSGYFYATVLLALGQTPRSLYFRGSADHAVFGRLLGHDHPDSAQPPPITIAVLDPEGHSPAAITLALGQQYIDPPIDEGRYTLSTDALADAASDARFVALDLVLAPGNPQELAEDTNGKLGGAEPLALEGELRRRGTLLLHVPAGDVDYFALALAPGELVSAACEGASGGSGVRGLTAMLVDGDDLELAIAHERLAQSLDLAPFQVGEDQRVFLRVSNDDQDDDIEPWVRCVVNTEPGTTP